MTAPVAFNACRLCRDDNISGMLSSYHCCGAFGSYFRSRYEFYRTAPVDLFLEDRHLSGLFLYRTSYQAVLASSSLRFANARLRASLTPNHRLSILPCSSTPALSRKSVSCTQTGSSGIESSPPQFQRPRLESIDILSVTVHGKIRYLVRCFNLQDY